MANPEIVVEEARSYSTELAIGVGRLVPDLVRGDDGSPASETLLREIIEGPRSSLFVARTSDDYVGTAVLNLMTHLRRRKAYLDYLIVSSELQSMGIGGRLYRAAGVWSFSRGAETMEWTSRSAQDFYLRQGAEINPTTAFRTELSPEEFGYKGGIVGVI